MKLHELVKLLEEQELPEFMHLPSINPRPSREAVFEVTEALHSLLFPGYFGQAEVGGHGFRYFLGHTLEWVHRELSQQITRGLCFRCKERGRVLQCQQEASEKVKDFLGKLPAIRESLSLDASAAYRGDPSANSPEEAIFCFPGMKALAHHRLAHELFKLNVPLIPRMMAERAHSLTGIDIHPGAEIGEGLFIDHGTGVVIGATCIIGKNVRIYQGVTLGAKSFPLDEKGDPIKGIPRHPIVEDDVVIYSGATVLGRITLGRGSIVGGNVWLTEGLPPYARVSQGQAKREDFEHGSGI
jgi:serine O-acetyltransferase